MFLSFILMFVFFFLSYLFFLTRNCQVRLIDLSHYQHKGFFEPVIESCFWQ